jgi:hypothetical protein
MATLKLYEDPGIIIARDQEHGWLYVDWIGEHGHDSILAGCRRMFDLLVHEKCNKVLNDNRHGEGVWTDTSEWLGTVWFPMMATGGLEYFAWVYSSDIHSRVAANMAVQFVTRPLVVPFDDFEAAQNWLKQV